MENKAPKVLLLDIETSPLTGYAWGFYEQNILKILEHCKIMSIGFKWLGDKQTTVVALPDFKGYKGGIIDDKLLVEYIWDLLDEADVVIAHHGDSFDIKKINARFAYYRLGAPSFYKTVDTRKVAARYFRFDSNKLNELGRYLGLGQKVKHEGFSMWEDCINGDPKAWAKMKAYNKGDVELLAAVYLTIRPFMTDHPNLNVIAKAGHSECTCPVCLSTNVSKRGFAITRTGRKQRFQCGDCGTWSTGPFTKANVTLR